VYLSGLANCRLHQDSLGTRADVNPLYKIHTGFSSAKSKRFILVNVD
jgi:hypothetical protein